MLSNCWKCKKKKKNKENVNPRISKTSNNKTILLSKCAILMIVKNTDLLKTKKQMDY